MTSSLINHLFYLIDISSQSSEPKIRIGTGTDSWNRKSRSQKSKLYKDQLEVPIKQTLLLFSNTNLLTITPIFYQLYGFPQRVLYRWHLFIFSTFSTILTFLGVVEMTSGLSKDVVGRKKTVPYSLLVYGTDPDRWRLKKNFPPFTYEFDGSVRAQTLSLKTSREIWCLANITREVTFPSGTSNEPYPHYTHYFRTEVGCKISTQNVFNV